VFINLCKEYGMTWASQSSYVLERKTILGGDLNAKHPVSNSNVSDPTGLKLLELPDSSNLEISTPQRLTHYTPDGRGIVLDTVVHENVRSVSLSSRTQITLK
jgi:hypothetical protein